MDAPVAALHAMIMAITMMMMPALLISPVHTTDEKKHLKCHAHVDDGECRGTGCKRRILMSTHKSPARLAKIVDSTLKGMGGGGGGSGQGANLPTMQDRVAFITERKRDALNCYLRTCCMRLAGDIIMGDTTPSA